jgi:hypothetical protein
MANTKYPQWAKKVKASGRGSGHTLDPGQRRKATQMDAIMARLKGWERPKTPPKIPKPPSRRPKPGIQKLPYPMPGMVPGRRHKL